MNSQLERAAAISFCIITLAAGLMANMFIIAVNFADWWRGRHLKASDRIHYLVAISRMGYQCHYVFTFLKFAYKFGLITDIRFYIRQLFAAVCFYTSVWMAALLSIFYFVKVANYQHVLFLHLKRMISQRLWYFIFAVLLISLCFSCLHTWALHHFLDASNSTYDVQITEIEEISTVYLVGSSGPFIIHICSLVPLLASLFWHMKKMKDGDTRFTSDHLDGYYVAIKSIASCFLLLMLEFITNVFYILANLNGMIWITIFRNALPSVHSIYLIYGTPKLRQRFSDMFKCGAK